MDKKMRTTLILGGVAVAAYLIYRWYENRQAANQTASPLGTNLNSASPSVLSSLSAGPSTELNYYGGTGVASSSVPVTTSGSSSTSITGTGSGDGTTSGQTASPAGSLSYWTPSSGLVAGVSPLQFLQAFQATGQNAGQIVPGGTGIDPRTGKKYVPNAPTS